MKILLIINDGGYGSEKAYNALRLAMALQKEHQGIEVWVFLMADAVTCAVAGQKTPDGYYNLERMLRAIANAGGQVKACGSCCEARGIAGQALAGGAEVSTMSHLARWTAEADKVISF
ncbi:MAG: DsrE family protein [Candidatus Eisenbacteria bacterium]|nr:DsrE family protein [Candidatus Eisenbacteria bacterium]